MKKALMIIVSLFVTPLMAQTAPKSYYDYHTLVTTYEANTESEIVAARLKYPEIDSEVSRVFADMGKAQVKISKITWLDAYLAKGGIDEAYFADGQCGTNTHGLVTVQPAGGEERYIPFSRFNSSNCGYPAFGDK